MKNNQSKKGVYTFILTFTLAIFSIYSCAPNIMDSVEEEINEPPMADSEIQLNVKVWPSTASNFTFPEDELQLRKTGICMSGGGTRAMTCAVGQLKALDSIGVLDSVGYISCVSGGSWASVPFTYYTKGASNDDELLGTIVNPKRLTLSNMDHLDPAFLAGAANSDLLGAVIKQLAEHPFEPQNAWINAVKSCYMDRYIDRSKYFSYDAATVTNICNRNSSTLSKTDFNTVRSGGNNLHRPYLVVNSSIAGFYEYAPYSAPVPLAVFNYTPLGVGSVMPQEAHYTQEKDGKVKEAYIGGGFIEPFAFGCDAPTSPSVRCDVPNQRNLCLKLIAPNKAFTIGDASGTSSSAFVASFVDHGIEGYSAKALTPQMPYWPVSAPKKEAAQDFIFGDGGNLENFGLISLLQRKVNKVIVFINTDVPINASYNINTFPTPLATDVTDDLLTLFGITYKDSENMNQNKVFDIETLHSIMRQLVTAKRNGTSLIAKTTANTVPNPWWGTGVESVEITWVYNDKVDEYISKLQPDIRNSILNENGWPHFENFPQYKTEEQNIPHLVELTARQINLLYQFSAWHVYTNSAAFDFIKQ